MIRCLMALALLSGLAGCRPETTYACTEIGCSDGLNVIVADNPPGPWRVDVSAPGDATRSFTCEQGLQCGSAHFPHFTPASVTVVVTYQGRSQQHQFTPAPNPVRPNGPRCEPVCNQPRVTVPLP